MHKWHPAKRLCVSVSSSTSQKATLRATLRTRPSTRPRQAPQEEDADDEPSEEEGRHASRAEEREPEDLLGADEGDVTFGRAEGELMRRMRLVGWQQRKGNAFVDQKLVTCTGGKGGDGAVSFMRYAFSPDNTPPDGAGGGRGGNVYVRVSDKYHGLGHLPRHATAGVGTKGMGDHRVGIRGKDVVLEVPVGTLVKEIRQPGQWPPASPDGEEPAEEDWEAYEQWAATRRDRIFTYYPGLKGSQRNATPEDERFFRAEAEVLMHERLLAREELNRKPVDVDLVEHQDDPLVVAVGGEGGKGNMSFVGGYCRLPKFGTKGMAGQKVVLELELKSLADVGLVGFPNSGKSSLLKAMSASKAEVASYPFTTLRPHLGTVIVYDDGSFATEGQTSLIEDTPSRTAFHGPQAEEEAFAEPVELETEVPNDKVESFRMVVADCPGILPDASKNVGLGRDFLRHIERASVLAYVVDLNSRDPAATLKTLHDELEGYKPGLSQRAKLIVANKADLVESRDKASARLAALAQVVPGLPILPTSARHRHNVARLVRSLRQHVEEARQQAEAHEPARKAERAAKLKLEVDRTVKRIGIFRRAGGIDYLQHATSADRGAAQQLYDAGLRRAKIEEARYMAQQSAQRALRTRQEAEAKRLDWQAERAQAGELS